ncbi:MAG: DUF3127 domain-containing protein [Bacteroidetes bacterium]|uniref:DUF3127 domain-containing protein n=1 Tax=Phaeocystidibacter marisrubri TaxID=1577780 RepID=A0A6L3ZEF2_9FLAO|nr:DUF3127 domain-containing protein [Phaeocystidibacter marisrubri]KAB2816060.1 DUF3127 domain-containing protein [Phaeocystidibacter marisrubri]TNE30661.1 MAG: DUF3127 domain-containing protein [Bacteroidota bacterium]GGH67136.1 hypothetical protein GCM10011318_05790 [Phaeocystidibacter marisrubri]
MELTGTVKKVFDEQQISSSFKKREMVLTTEEQYPQSIMVEFVQDKTDLLDRIKEGDRVNVSINIRGREWQSPQGETRYFVSIQGWKIQAEQPAAAAGGSEPPMDSYSASDFPSDEQEDDLPF